MQTDSNRVAGRKNTRIQMNKSDELFGVHKIPDNILVRQLLEERGKNLSYIQELEEELGRSNIISGIVPNFSIGFNTINERECS